VLVVVAPGQGAQSPGFLTPWLDIPEFRDRLEWLSVVCGIDLIEYGTNADAETLTDTAIAQPLIVGVGLVSLLNLFPHPALAYSQVGAGAGHSVGEITAAVGAGVISAEQAMVFVRERGRAMAAAAAATPTGMRAVLGGDPDAVVAAAEAAGLTPANMNGAGQIVIAGTIEDLDAFTPPDGARVRPLGVAGAFHTAYMAPAVDMLSRYARSISTHDARLRIISNADGQIVHDGREVLRRLVTQVSNPVRWDLCMQTMGDLGVTGVIEVPPAGTLTGLVKRALPGVETLALKTPDDLAAAHTMIERHTSPAHVETPPTWRVIVAPAKGIFRAETITDVGAALEPSALVGTLHSARSQTPITATHGGIILEWLVHDGDPVSPGQPLIRLHPKETHA
jgi:[acyl-carrier-protein] S-malonyltransferase